MIWVGEKGRRGHSLKETSQGNCTRIMINVGQNPTKLSLDTKFTRKSNTKMSHAFEKFLAELKLLLKDCGYRDPDELVRDRVVIGCRSQKSKREANTEGFEANNRTSYRRSSHP